MIEKIYMVDGKASFTCPVCSQRKTESVSQYLKQETTVEIESTCICGHTWTSILERRKHYRKPVKLRGSYTFRNDIILQEGLSAGSFVGKGKMRKDRFLNPLNSDFDLYSMGPDGQSRSPLVAKASRDDVIRANDGQYFGRAAYY